MILFRYERQICAKFIALLRDVNITIRLYNNRSDYLVTYFYWMKMKNETKVVFFLLAVLTGFGLTFY